MEATERFVEVALKVFPEVIEAVKAKIVEMGKADAATPADEVLAAMSRLIVAEVERHNDEIAKLGMDAVKFLAYMRQHKAELDVYFVAHPENKAKLDVFMNPFSL
jgi:hypothetical protein